jgi:hypothetical protein
LPWRLGHGFSDDEAGEIMDLQQQLELLTSMVRLIEEMQLMQVDYLGKDKVVQHLRWSTEHLSNDIWARTIHKDYTTNGNA